MSKRIDRDGATVEGVVKVLVIVGPNAAAATATTFIDGEELVAVGDARKHPVDTHDPAIARDLAAGRALVTLGCVLAERAGKAAGCSEVRV